MDQLNWAKRAFGLFLLSATTAIALPAQTFTTLHSFDNTDGYLPSAGLVQGIDGNLYGTTSSGGANGGGTIFRITPGGAFASVYNFCSLSSCVDGSSPGALVVATDGSLYGTTGNGGAHGYGTVFRITPNGALTAVYSFCSKSNCTDGARPGPLIQAVDGNFYGTTVQGGNSNQCGLGCGTIFKVSSAGALKTLYSFCVFSNCLDGDNPMAGLVEARNGAFYGVTPGGTPGSLSRGEIFILTLAGMVSILDLFQGGAGPNNLLAALVQGLDGNLYGTSAGGGFGNCSGGCGTFFKITPLGAFTQLASFGLQSGDPSGPTAALVQAQDRNFYSTTAGGGTFSNGTVYKVTASGTLTGLYSFCSQTGCVDGSTPIAPLAQDTNGEFYGTTLDGGTSSACSFGCGTIFSLDVGLGPFVESNPAAGKVGKAVKILGTKLTGATSVTFNGTAATFTVVSHSLITTTVPAGATTGKVKVTIPSGTLSSNVPFRVLP
ncbi:MAG TPA: choice-of-anchor tandem repeat GloVer-containing protein [Terriglobia bacterium]|nr:choice-of-anchor tandem repeat GloVer-containing protein [Terriglobia bacterium]